MEFICCAQLFTVVHNKIMFLSHQLYSESGGDGDYERDFFIKNSRPVRKHTNINTIKIYKTICPEFESSKIFTILKEHPNQLPLIYNSHTKMWEYYLKYFSGANDVLSDYYRMNTIYVFRERVKNNMIKSALKYIFSRQVLQELMSVVLHPDNIHMFAGWGYSPSNILPTPSAT